MEMTLHITSGDIAGERIANSTVSGEVFVWHDILYDGPRIPGWPDEKTLGARARFLERLTGGGLARASIFDTLTAQYDKLKTAAAYQRIVLWFDACLFDQAMLCHILTCLTVCRITEVELLCIDAFTGIDPYNGLGQLSPEQLASMYDSRKPVSPDTFTFAARVDRAFALQDLEDFKRLSALTKSPLPWIPAAIKRWLKEQPDKVTGLGRLEQLALEAVNAGCTKPYQIFSHAAKRDDPPQYWTDISLWARLNGLADREPPLLRIEGPNKHLPQWQGGPDLNRFRIYPADKDTEHK